MCRAGPANQQAQAIERITQEACVNTVRHGDAEHLTVSLARRDGHVELTVRDTGTGFDPGAPHAGTGLAHIRARADDVISAVRAAAAGTAHLSPELLTRLTRALRQLPHRTRSRPASARYSS